MKRQLRHRYEDVISLENLLLAWKEFVSGKRTKPDVQEFGFHLMDNLVALHEELLQRTWSHGLYQAFNISDPKPRNIHKASVRDRLLHHAIYRMLYSFFDRVFIADSFSCRIGKGTHKALDRFRSFAYAASKNHIRTCWVLKCDIKKFFANIDHAILFDILRQYIPDSNLMWLLERVVGSFHSTRPGVGLPLGNLTSQLLVNVYMNEFDQFIKQRLRVKRYVRYADDFVILSGSREQLEFLVPCIQDFLWQRLRLTLHPDKVFIKTWASGIDFLGWVNFVDHRVLRTTTKHRMFKRVHEHPTAETVASYMGLLSHGNTHSLQERLPRHGS
jgi:retron-type reverse transcriptase